MFDFDLEFIKMMEQDRLRHVIILGHINPDGDAAGSVMALAHYIHDVFPDVSVHPFLAPNLEKGAKKLVEEDTVFLPFQSITMDENVEYATIVCDASTINRIAGVEWFHSAKITMVIDHHEINEGYGDINHIECISSCAEVIFKILHKKELRSGGKEYGKCSSADYLYMGMLHDTKVFSTLTGASTMEMAKTLLEKGVDHQRLLQTFHASTLGDYVKESGLVSMVEEVADGKIACLYLSQQEKERLSVSWDHAKTVCNKLKSIEGVCVSIVFFEQESGVWRISCRADGISINASKFLEPYGGGGHPYAAGLTIKIKAPEKLKEEILARIVAEVG